MKDLLKLEFRKLRKQKSFYIILAIMVIFVAISAGTTKLLENLAEQLNEVGEEFGETFSATGISVLLGVVSSSMFSTLTAIYVAIIVCDDYENQIIKNIYARGYTRLSFFLAKLFYVLITTTVMFLCAVATSWILGATLFSINGDVGKIVLLLAVQWLSCMAYVAAYFAISVMIRKLGGTIAANIIGPMVVSLLLGLLDTFIEIENFSFTDVWFTSFAGSLTTLSVETGRIIVCAILSAGYFASFTTLGYFFSERTEI